LVFEDTNLVIEGCGLALVNRNYFRWRDHEGKILEALLVDGTKHCALGFKAGEVGIEIRH
jgi:hypothetical protein